MRRGTTPTHEFSVDVDLTSAEEIYISYRQGGKMSNKVLVEKDINDIIVEPDKLTVTLTQEDTLAFRVGSLEVQIRARMPDDRAYASQIMTAPVEPAIKEGVI